MSGASEEFGDLVARLDPSLGPIEPTTMFGSSGYKVRNKTFAMCVIVAAAHRYVATAAGASVRTK